MRKVSIESVLPGQQLAKTIFSGDGTVLLDSGVELTPKQIKSLTRFRIKEIFIEDEISQGIECSDTIKEEISIESKILIRKIMDTNAIYLDEQFELLEKYVSSIIDELLDSPEIVINLNQIKIIDDYTFEHSVSVCIFSLIIGIKIGYSQQSLLELGIGALLHDIGKLKIPDNILKKPGHLSDAEFETIKKHTFFGYDILKKCRNISVKSAEVALYHHERMDGSGYPNSLNFEDIPEYARITSIADVFDALTSDRVYRNKLGIKEVLDYMTSPLINHLDKELVNHFIKLIALFPEGSGVLLSTGEKGIVVTVNNSNPQKPVVRVVKDKFDNKLENFYEIDLSINDNLFIVENCEV